MRWYMMHWWTLYLKDDKASQAWAWRKNTHHLKKEKKKQM